MNVLDDLIKIDDTKNIAITGLTSEFFALYLSKLNQINNNILVVTNTLYEANKIYDYTSNYTDNISIFPMDDFLTSEALAISPDLKISRLETINKIINNKKNIVVTNLTGYLRYLPKKEVYENSIINLKKGTVFDPKKLLEKLIDIGYNTESLVTQTGEIGYRGFVIDVFPINYDYPIRIEFFGDEVESIRKFNPIDQKSDKNLNEINIYPFWEFITTGEVSDEDLGLQKMLPNYSKHVSNILEYLDDCTVIFKASVIAKPHLLSP